jgi:hypothetical protein
MYGDTACCEIRHDVVLPRQHVRDLIVESLVISLRGGRTQQPLGTTRPEALYHVEDANALVSHSRTP